MKLERQAVYQKGVEAENVAARYFEAQGYDVLQQRYKTKFGEIDLVVPETLIDATGIINAHNLLGGEGVHHLDNAWLAGQ